MTHRALHLNKPLPWSSLSKKNDSSKIPEIRAYQIANEIM